ncbi:MAG: anhydro-N-acetylmuramic acid kinase [Nitrospirae bacterium]|nr:anhydro-N-acetylmuramic acid kinase [Nitrospirota bacterium]
MRVIGLSSGTSVDGIDAALTDITGHGQRVRLRLLAYRTFAYPRGLRPRLLALQSGGRTEELCHLNAYLGELFADAARRLAKSAGIPLRGITLIGSHGQTVAHRPVPIREGRHWVRSTLQIGEPSVIAERTGVLTVADFRPRDLAAGGQGAPLTPLIHHRCFSHSRRNRLVVNLGGIANVTWLPAGGSLDRLVAFDTGPGNMVIDGLMERITRGRRTMDRSGRTAAAGTVRTELLRSLLRHPYLRLPPPKTTGRELFGRPLIDRVWRRVSTSMPPRDLIATVTAFTASSIADAYDRFLRRRGLVHDVIVGGGGVYNSVLMKQLADAFEPVPVRSMAAYGIDPKAIEAMAFALLAYTTMQGEPNNVPQVTGARHPVILGKVIPTVD